MSIADKQRALVDEFQRIPSWEERYKRIIDLARNLPAMPDAYKTDDKKVRGCSSTVWLHSERRDDRVDYLADSDAVLVRGLVAILLQVYSGEKAEDILKTPPTFIEQLGLNTNLSPNRANGLVSMVNQIKKLALDAVMARQKELKT